MWGSIAGGFIFTHDSESTVYRDYDAKSAQPTASTPNHTARLIDISFLYDCLAGSIVVGCCCHWSNCNYKLSITMCLKETQLRSPLEPSETKMFKHMFRDRINWYLHRGSDRWAIRRSNSEIIETTVVYHSGQATSANKAQATLIDNQIIQL